MESRARLPGAWFSGQPDRAVLWTEEGSTDASATRSMVDTLAARFASAGSAARVVIAGDTNARTALAIVAARQAGCATVVVDKRLPLPYVRQLCEHVRPDLVAFRTRRAEMANAATTEGVDFFDIDRFLDRCRVDLGDRQHARRAAHRDGERPVESAEVPATADGPMVLFSSGTSGDPKGVVQSRVAIDGEAARYQEWIRPVDDTRLAIVSSLGFTSSPASLAAMWRYDGSMAFYDLFRKGIGGLVPFLRASRTTNMRMQTAVLRAMCDLDGLATTHLRSVSVAGEPLFPADVERFRRAFPPGCVLHMAYSSTETGTIAEQYVRPDDSLPDSCNELRTSTGTTVGIVDELGRPVPIGEIGEIVVSSPTLAVGYLGRPTLTTERFDHGGETLRFRTRDLGRWLDEETFSVVGRHDHRLKIRGYNVEPSVVESALMRYPGVTDCVVVGAERHGGGTLLAAYPVAPFTQRPSVGALREFLRTDLPDHLIPSIFHVVDELPRLGTGKADRSLLAERASIERFQLRPIDAPTTRRQQVVHDLVSRLVGIPSIGIDDDLLNLGLDSLMLGELVLRLEDAFDASPGIGAIVAEPTIRAIAAAPATAGIVLSPLVRTSSRSTDRFFVVIVPGAGASISYLRPLALELSELGPVHGVNAAQHVSITRLVNATTTAIIGCWHEHRLPVVVIGHSWGGVVAAEVVRRLGNVGVSAARLVLLDSSRAPEKGSWPQRVARRGAWSVRSAIRPRARLDSIRRTRQRDHASGVALSITREGLSSIGDDVFARQMRSLATHRVRRVAVDAIYVRTEDDPATLRYWESVVCGPLVTIDARGSHSSMLAAPFVRDLGAALCREIASEPSTGPVF